MQEHSNHTGKAGIIIEDIAGCGKFQVILCFLVYFLACSGSAYTLIFMSFANYNPGWRCNDPSNSSISTTRMTTFNVDQESVTSNARLELSRSGTKRQTFIDTYVDPMRDNCPLFDSCKNIEFDPSSVTIVSEWGLLCSRRWIFSIIISLQMAGNFIGSFFSGYISDATGRKPSIYVAVLSIAILNAVSIYSFSWEMYAAIRFVLGFFLALVVNNYFILVAEFVTGNWRSLLTGIPVWNISSTIFAVACMVLKNWRYATIFIATVGFVGFLPVFWVPESLRWLEVKGKTKRFIRVAEKIVGINGKTLSSTDLLHQMEMSSNNKNDMNNVDLKEYNTLHLFRNGYTKQTILVSIAWITTAELSYSLVLGVKVLHGNFYMNLIVSTSIDIPFCFVPMYLPNLIGRRKAGMVFSGVFGICTLGSAILGYTAISERIENIGIPTLIFIAKAFSGGLWDVFYLLTLELYPTVIRGLGMSWGGAMVRVGGVLSTFLIPNAQNDASGFYAILGFIGFIIFGIFVTLPETKGLSLQDVYGKGKGRNTVYSDDTTCEIDKKWDKHDYGNLSNIS